jgi:hypothetical protein
MVCDCRCIAETIYFQSLTIFSDDVVFVLNPSISLALQNDPMSSKALVLCRQTNEVLEEKCGCVRYKNHKEQLL